MTFFEINWLTDATQSISPSAGAWDVTTESKAFRIREASANITTQCPASTIVVDDRFKQTENCPWSNSRVKEKRVIPRRLKTKILFTSSISNVVDWIHWSVGGVQSDFRWNKWEKYDDGREQLDSDRQHLWAEVDLWMPDRIEKKLHLKVLNASYPLPACQLWRKICKSQVRYWNVVNGSPKAQLPAWKR